MNASATSPPPRRRFRRVTTGLSKITGYALSMILLAVVSLMAIPSMVTASGAAAWGMIAAGQSIGGVAAVIIAYGWGMSGPAAIARADAPGRLREYAESVVCKLLICLPFGAAAFAIAWAVGRDYALFAACGALSTASVGLTANWWFVGLSQPYRLLVFETVPRVAGTFVGILLMEAGASALVGVLWQLIGMLAAFVVCTLWILRPWRLRALRRIERRPVGTVLAAQRNGLTSTVVSSLYAATPIVLVSLIAPGVQPVYAVVEKVQRQVIVGLGPFVTVLQGWIPRARGAELLVRVKRGMIAATIGASILGILMFVAAQELVAWLGGGLIHPTIVTLLLMSVITAVSLVESVASKAALSALNRLDVAAKATSISAIVGLPLVALGALLAGASGALSGILAGLSLRLLLELLGMQKAMAHSEAQSRSVSIDPEVEVGGA
ncbi:hypothetical protein GCM10022381_31340 [Leifsonia kafniensis]|uniref:O-antigen/teichoic acid export membrane protein n=1 Tax=Leifsonia kafniensis TaxID=475957 RepID=A0ABP7KVR5_9MICO